MILSLQGLSDNFEIGSPIEQPIVSLSKSLFVSEISTFSSFSVSYPHSYSFSSKCSTLSLSVSFEILSVPSLVTVQSSPI